MGNFCATKVTLDARVLSEAVHSAAVTFQSQAIMPNAKSTKILQERNRNLLVEQRKLLHHLPEWLRFRGLGQNDVAEALGVSEGQVSRWFTGTDQMKVGYFRQIAALLRAKPEDLIGPPGAVSFSAPVGKLLDAIEGLSPEEISHLAVTAELMKRKQ